MDKHETRGQLVVKSNDIIQTSRINLSLNAQKCLLYCISKIKPDDDSFDSLEFEIVEFIETAGIGKSGMSYKTIRKALQEVADKSIWYPNVDEKGKVIGHTLLRFLSHLKMNYRDGTIKIKFHDEMKPFLLELRKNYTTYELARILPMKSKYSIKLYELLKSHAWKAQHSEKRKVSQVFDALYLREYFQTGKSYKLFSEFNKNVISKAVSEINKYTELHITFNPLKTKNKYTHINFIIELISDGELFIRNNQIAFDLDGE